MWGSALEGQVGTRAPCWISEAWYQLLALTRNTSHCCLPSYTAFGFWEFSS